MKTHYRVVVTIQPVTGGWDEEFPRVVAMTEEKSREIFQIIAKAEDKGLMSASEGMRESLYKARRKPKCNESYAAVCKVLDECRLFATNAGL